MKPTKPFLHLLILAVLFVSVYSAEAPYNLDFQENQEYSLSVRKLHLLAEFTLLVKSLYLCLKRFGVKDIGKHSSDSSTLSLLATDLNMFILENKGDMQINLSSLYFRLICIMNVKLKECYERTTQPEWTILESISGRLGVIGKDVIKIIQALDGSSFGRKMSPTIEQTVVISIKLFIELTRIIKTETKKRNDQKTKEEELIKYKDREELSNLNAHILVGCCSDGKCNSLDPSKKKDRGSRKKNRGGKKKRTVAENQNKNGQFEADQSNDEQELLNVNCEDQLIKESVGAVSELIRLLQKIATLEENLLEVSNLFELNIRNLKDKFESFNPSESLFMRFNVLLNEEANHKYKSESVKTPSREYILKLCSKSSLYGISGSAANEKTNHCHHSTHKCKEKTNNLIINPD
ncbi:Signal peptide region containing protein [Cryptosporidium tyzzeri]|nr:Signal peptide region containing protein [Cryptosporidium tyzzeri]